VTVARAAAGAAARTANAGAPLATVHALREVQRRGERVAGLGAGVRLEQREGRARRGRGCALPVLRTQVRRHHAVELAAHAAAFAVTPVDETAPRRRHLLVDTFFTRARREMRGSAARFDR
jgi:hypothetical protein